LDQEAVFVKAFILGQSRWHE